MGLTATDKGGGDFAICPEDTHIARCYRIIDLGTHHDEKYNKDQHKIQISWELPESLMTGGDYDGKPFSVHNRYTVSLNEKANLRKHLEAWRGKKFTDKELEGFAVNVLVDKACYINVVHSTDGKYANIGSILKLPKGVECPDAVNEQLVFDLDKFDQEVFDKLSDNLQTTIKESFEYQELFSDAPESSQGERTDSGDEEFGDEIPF
jgi:hypothetical protein